MKSATTKRCQKVVCPTTLISFNNAEHTSTKKLKVKKLKGGNPNNKTMINLKLSCKSTFPLLLLVVCAMLWKIQFHMGPHWRSVSQQKITSQSSVPFNQNQFNQALNCSDMLLAHSGPSLAGYSIRPPQNWSIILHTNTAKNCKVCCIKKFICFCCYCTEQG